MLGEGSFGHAGAGGHMGFAHPESGFAVANVCNNMRWDSQASDPSAGRNNGFTCLGLRVSPRCCPRYRF